MKNKVFIGLAAALALSAFTACSESSGSSEPTKAELCANGLSKECLIGSWDMVGFASNSTGEIFPNFDYTANPGKLIFKDVCHIDGCEFEFDLPSAGLTRLNPLDYPVYGRWTIEDKTLKLHSISTALYKSNYETVPVVKVEGAVVKMMFGGLWLMENETDESNIKTYGAEVYTISAQ